MMTTAGGPHLKMGYGYVPPEDLFFSYPQEPYFTNFYKFSDLKPKTLTNFHSKCLKSDKQNQFSKILIWQESFLEAPISGSSGHTLIPK